MLEAVKPRETSGMIGGLSFQCTWGLKTTNRTFIHLRINVKKIFNTFLNIRDTKPVKAKQKQTT